MTEPTEPRPRRRRRATPTAASTPAPKPAIQPPPAPQPTPAEVARRRLAEKGPLPTDLKLYLGLRVTAIYPAATRRQGDQQGPVTGILRPANATERRLLCDNGRRYPAALELPNGQRRLLGFEVLCEPGTVFQIAEPT